jgi:hypothetical protein
MKTLVRASVVLALLAAQGLASAGPRYYHHHHHHRGPGLGGLVLGLAVAVPLIAMANQAEREVVYVPPPPPPPQPVYVQPVQPVYTQPSRSVPIIYPRSGQSSVQLEADSRECNRWATTQQAAMSDAGVFQRAVEACMDGRGYTMR